LGGHWILLDPAWLSPQSSFIRIPHGRDAADTSFAAIFGNATMRDMKLSTELADGKAQAPRYLCRQFRIGFPNKTLRKRRIEPIRWQSKRLTEATEEWCWVVKRTPI
jgi:hypothetical protein